MSTLKQRCNTLRNEFKARLGYSLISAIIITIILLLIKKSDMPSADQHISLGIVAAYAAIAVATHIISDAISYIVAGFSMSLSTSWQGTFNTILSIMLMGAAFSYVEATSPGGIVIFFDGKGNLPQILLSNYVLAIIAAAITSSFARNSERRKEELRISEECSAINDCIARRNAEKSNATCPIIMDQIIKLDTAAASHSSEFAVCDIIYAHRTSNQHITLAYNCGRKVCRTCIDGNIADLLQAFANYSQIMRCHKDYIVNTDLVNHVSYNRNQYLLQMRGTKHIIPVSHKYQRIIYDTLTAE